MIPVLLLGLWGLLGAWAQASRTSFSHPQDSGLPGVWREEAETGRDPVQSNLCPYQTYKLVTFIAACKTEKYVVHSQQPCPQEAPDCQQVKVMYRMAQKPVYQVKQKLMASINWRCCPGFAGPDCQHHDPAAIPESTDLGDDLPESWDRPASLEPAHRPIAISSRAGELQSDTHQPIDGPPGLWKAQESNLEAVVIETNQSEANQTESEPPGTDKEQTVRLQVDAFLRAHLGPIWSSFQESLHSLSQAVRNLSLDVEANQQAIRRLEESMVSRDDFQEFGTKFETKVQENTQRVGELRQEVEGRLDAQQLSLQDSLSQVQAELDSKVKKVLKAQEGNDSLLGAAVGTAARPEPESLQARLGQLQRNLSALHAAAGHREEELSSALAGMRVTLTQHQNEIKELYSESDETFDQISKVEELVRELQVNHTALRELRVILMEKSLIMEENKEELERQLLELNLTLQHLQGAHTDLVKYIKDCNCQKLDFDLDVIREGQRGTPRALGETQGSPDAGSLQALGRRVDALAEALDSRAAEDQQVRADASRLRTQLRTLGGEVAELRDAEAQARLEVRQLHSAFTALLEDALRHEAVLTALFGEELLEEMSEQEPDPLPLTYEQIRVGLQDAASGLQEQALGWDALAARVEDLERGGGVSPVRAQALPPLPAEHLESSHDANREEASGSDLTALAQELQRLNLDVESLGQCCSEAASTSSVLQGLQTAVAANQRDLEQHLQLFSSLFGNFQGLVSANVSLDLEKLQAVLNRKAKKQQRDLGAPKKRGKKQVEPLSDAHGQVSELGTLKAQLWETGAPVAFYASFSEGTAPLQTLKFNTTYINIGNSYFPKHGYFRAPERGVYLFAVSIEFGPGPGSGQLVFGGHHQTSICTTDGQRGGSTVTTFAMAELQKGERVWFELTQGSVIKRSPSGTAFGGFLIFKI